MHLQKLNLRIAFMLIVLTATSILISCGKDDKTAETKDKKGNKGKTDSTETAQTNSSSGSGASGKEIFYMKSNQNNIACADCHSDGTNSSNTLTKYFSNIQGANKRTSTFLGKFKGEEVIKNAGGATVCWEEYMRMKSPLTEEQINALNTYYETIAVANSPTELKYETIALPTKDKAKLKEVQTVILALKGDPVKGEKDFNNSCAFCHGENSTIRKVPSILEDFDGNTKSITFNVKFGDDAMPFFKNEVLSDQEIADISAYIVQNSSK